MISSQIIISNQNHGVPNPPLVTWIGRLDQIEIPPRLIHVHDVVVVLVRKRATTSNLITIGQHWITCFLNQHPEISAWFASRIDHQREVGGKPEGIKSFFDRLSEVRSRYRIQAEDIWDADEKGFALEVAKGGKVLCNSKRRNPRIRHPGNREWVTLMEGISAIRRGISPLYIYKGEAHLMGNHDYEERDLASFAISKTGWTNDSLEFLWLKEVFEPKTRSGRDRLLIIDGHSSHLTVELIEFCFDHSIHILCFPRHSTHLLQLLDVGIVGPLGRYYSDEVDTWARTYSYQVIRKGDFFPLWQKA